MNKEQVRDKIKEYLKRVEKWKTKSRVGKANTITKLIEPLLKILGWDVESEEVYKEYYWSEEHPAVDIALLVSESPKIFIEARSIEEKGLGKYAPRLLKESGESELAEWYLVSNGDEFNLYNISWKGVPETERLFFALSGAELEDKLDLLWLLAKESVLEGKLDEESRKEYTFRALFYTLQESEKEIIQKMLAKDERFKRGEIKQNYDRILASFRLEKPSPPEIERALVVSERPTGPNEWTEEELRKYLEDLRIWQREALVYYGLICEAKQKIKAAELLKLLSERLGEKFDGYKLAKMLSKINNDLRSKQKEPLDWTDEYGQEFYINEKYRSKLKRIMAEIEGTKR